MNPAEANRILRLSDSQLAIVRQAAVPLSPSARDRYLKPSRPSWRRPSASMMRPSKPWSRPCSARSSIDDSSRTMLATICPGAAPEYPLSDLTMSYFSVDGLVSGIKSHMIEAPSKATAVILRNVVAWPKLAAIRPKTAVLSAAPSPDAVPMMP